MSKGKVSDFWDLLRTFTKWKDGPTLKAPIHLCDVESHIMFSALPRQLRRPNRYFCAYAHRIHRHPTSMQAGLKTALACDADESFVQHIRSRGSDPMRAGTRIWSEYTQYRHFSSDSEARCLGFVWKVPISALCMGPLTIFFIPWDIGCKELLRLLDYQYKMLSYCFWWCLFH